MAPRHSDVTGEARRQERLRGETDNAAEGRGGKGARRQAAEKKGNRS